MKKKDFSRSHISPNLRSSIKDAKPYSKISVSPSRGVRLNSGSIGRKGIKGPVSSSKNSNLDSRNSAQMSSVSPSSRGWSRNHRQIYASERFNPIVSTIKFQGYTR